MDERTRLKDIDVQDPVCDEFYQTWMKSAERNIDLFDEVPFSVCLFLSLSVYLSVCLSVHPSLCLSVCAVHRKFVIILYNLI